MNRQESIDQVIAKLEEKDPHERSLAFHDMSKWTAARLSGPMNYSGYLAGKWWTLLKENTWLVTADFTKFTKDVLAALSKEKWSMSELAYCYYQHTISDQYFRSIAESCVETEIVLPSVEGKGRLVTTLQAGDDVFLVVSGARKDYMPVYDFTASGSSLTWLMNVYARLVSAIPGCQVCLVKKSVGPFGPVRHIENIRKLLPTTNIFVYSQEIDSVVPEMGTPIAGKPVVILYDLFATGKGLNNHVARPLLRQYANELAGVPIYACVIHAFDEDCPGENTLWTSRLCSYDVFVGGGASRGPDILCAKPDSADENANFLSRVIYLNKGSLSDFKGKKTFEFSTSETWGSKSPSRVFHHRKREDIYQVPERV